MAEFYIAVGSNIEPETSLSNGLILLASRVQMLRISTHYRCAPIGERRQPEYINGIWHGQTELEPLKLKETLRHIEEKCGRVRFDDPCAPRTLDLDLILYDGLHLDERESGLLLPHPDIRERAFIYIPLLELEPDIRLPGDDSALSGLVNPDMELYYSPITEILRNLLDSGL